MSSVRCGDASCQGSLMMLLWFRVMISIRANFSADTLAGPPRPRPPPRPPSRPGAGGCAGACARAVALMPAAAATVKKLRRFIGRLLTLLRELVRDVRQ